MPENKIFYKKKLFWILITFIISFIPKLIVALFYVPYSSYDEGPTIACAAYLAGYNWSDIMSQSAYYGFGYYALFAPLFLITDNPYYIYIAIAIFNAFVQSLYGLIAFHILSYFFKMKDYMYICLAATICSYFTNTARIRSYNETPLILLHWLITWNLCCLIKNRQNNKKKLIYTLSISLLIAYSLLIHTRAILLPIILIVVIILYMLLYKEMLLSLKAIPFLILSIMSSRFLIKTVQKLVWLKDSSENLANASINIGSAFRHLNIFDLITWKALFYTIIGQLATLNLFSSGLFIMSIVIILIYFNILKSKNGNFLLNEKNRYYVVLCVLFILCCFGTVVAQSLKWMYSLYPSLQQISETGITGKESAFKAFSYIRYMGAYAGPFVMCALSMILEGNIKYKKKYNISIILTGLIIQIIWMQCVYPLIANNGEAFEAYAPFSFRKPFVALSSDKYFCSVIWICNAYFIFMLSITKKNKKLYLSYVLVILIFQFIFMGITNDREYGIARAASSSEAYNFIQKLEANGLAEKDIYADNFDNQRLQFYLNRYKIHTNPPLDDDYILFYEGKIENINNTEYYNCYYVKLDKQVYVFIKGADYISLIKKCGYRLEHT